MYDAELPTAYIDCYTWNNGDKTIETTSFQHVIFCDYSMALKLIASVALNRLKYWLKEYKFQSCHGNIGM